MLSLGLLEFAPTLPSTVPLARATQLWFCCAPGNLPNLTQKLMQVGQAAVLM